MSLNLNVVLLGGGIILGGFILANELIGEGPGRVIRKQAELETKSLGKKLIGEECGNNQDCSREGSIVGPPATAFDQVGCCSNTCKWKKKDWLGVYYCPEDLPNASTKGLGSPCDDLSDCSVTGRPNGDPVTIFDKIGCCKGKCTHKRRDLYGLWYCPDECVSQFLGPPGKCAISPEEINIRNK